IIGGITSNAASIISELAEKSKIPFITPYATSPEITRGKKFVFRACFDDDYQARKIAEFAFKDLRRRRAEILVNSTSIYSNGIAKIFAARFKELGGTVSGQVEFASEKDVDEAMIAKVEQDRPDVVILPSYQIEAAAILSKLTPRLPQTLAYIGTDGWVGG